jgi:non-heme chloroperoxidase
MRKKDYLMLDRTLTIQIPGLIAGGFVQHMPGGQGPGLPTGPHDLPTRTIAVGGTTLHYFEFGSGHPVIFVHGAFADYRAWLNQIEAFGQRYRSITYSRRHHYPNVWHDDGQDASTALHGEDLAQLISRLDAGPATLVGQSLGATIALHAAIANPALVHSLVLSEPFILPWLQASRAGQEAWADFENRVWRPSAVALRSGHRDACIRLVTDGIMGAGAYDGLPSDVKPLVLDNAAELRLEHDNPHYYSAVGVNDVASLHLPILLVKGDSSPRMFHIIAEELVQCLPAAETLELANVCHVAPLLAPDAFNEAVFAFLQRHGVAPRE